MKLLIRGDGRDLAPRTAVRPLHLGVQAARQQRGARAGDQMICPHCGRSMTVMGEGQVVATIFWDAGKAGGPMSKGRIKRATCSPSDIEKWSTHLDHIAEGLESIARKMRVVELTLAINSALKPAKKKLAKRPRCSSVAKLARAPK